MRLVLAAAALTSLAVPARAQDIGRLETESLGSGVLLGTFLVQPRLAFENYVDDNVFATSDGEVSDYVASIAPSLRAVSSWSRHSLSLGAVGRFNLYADETREDNEEYAIAAEGRLDLTAGSALDTMFSHRRRTLGRANSENTGRDSAQQVDLTEGMLGYAHELGPFVLELDGFAARVDFVDSLDADRDRVEFGGGLRLSRLFSATRSIFIEPSVESRDYEQKRDDTGLERSSVAIVGLAGAAFDINSVVSAELAVGPAFVEFDESSFDDIVTVAVLGEIRWDITRLTRLDAEVKRGVVPTDVRGASSKIRTRASLELRHQLLRNLLLSASATYFREDFKELSRDDDNFWIGAGAEYALNRFLSITARYAYRQRDSNVGIRDFHQNLVMLGFDVHL